MNQTAIQATPSAEIGITKQHYIQQIFDIASKNKDKVAVDVSQDLTAITWSRENHGVMFGVRIMKELSLDEQAYEAARTYNLTLNLGIAEPTNL